MLRSFLSFCTIIFVAVLTIACESNDEPELTESQLLTQKIFGDSGHFRGNSIGDNLSDVRKNDRGFLFKQQPDELNYSIPFSSLDSALIDIAYVFDDEQLFEIQADVLPNSEKEVSLLFESFQERLSFRYGSPSEKPNYSFWEASENGRQLEITLRDVSGEYDRPFLSLNIIEPHRTNY